MIQHVRTARQLTAQQRTAVSCRAVSSNDLCARPVNYKQQTHNNTHTLTERLPCCLLSLELREKQNFAMDLNNLD